MIVVPGVELDSYDRPSVFLAGPTPRDDVTPSWRPEAVEIFDRIGFFKHDDGMIFAPEPWGGDWTEQVEWEENHLKKASCIMFWIDRNLKTMPGFTTNIEWGVWCKSRKVVLGAPSNAPKTRYIKHYANKYNIPNFMTLENTVERAAKMAVHLYKNPRVKSVAGIIDGTQKYKDVKIPVTDSDDYNF